ncbi:MAG: hypothetical protein ACRDPE_00775, partial [Solirubrobacterales bacterium]
MDIFDPSVAPQSGRIDSSITAGNTRARTSAWARTLVDIRSASSYEMAMPLRRPFTLPVEAQ